MDLSINWRKHVQRIVSKKLITDQLLIHWSSAPAGWLQYSLKSSVFQNKKSIFLLLSILLFFPKPIFLLTVPILSRQFSVCWYLHSFMFFKKKCYSTLFLKGAARLGNELVDSLGRKRLIVASQLITFLHLPSHLYIKK